MNLTASFAKDAVGFFTAAVCVLDPKAARRRLDDDANRRLNQVRPDHGWVGEKRADGTIYYTLRTLDAHGFERGMGSRHPPAGIDLTSIPVVDQGPGFPIEQWLAQTRALVMAFEPGQVFQLGRLGRCTAAVSLGAERHGLLHRLDALDAIIQEGFARELRDRWLDAVQNDGAATLGADIERAAADFVVDAAVAGMARLMQAALLAAGPQSLPAQMLTRAFGSHVSAFGIDAPQDQLALEIMYLRKCRLPELPLQMANLFLEESTTAAKAGLAAPDLPSLIRCMFAATHAGEVARRIFEDLVRVAGEEAPILWRRSLNVAEENVVRASGSISNAFQNLDGVYWARHRHSVQRALAAGGVERRELRADDLIIGHWFYPHAWKPLLIAEAPIGDTGEEILGFAYAQEYFRIMGYAI